MGDVSVIGIYLNEENAMSFAQFQSTPIYRRHKSLFYLCVTSSRRPENSLSRCKRNQFSSKFKILIQIHHFF